MACITSYSSGVSAKFLGSNFRRSAKFPVANFSSSFQSGIFNWNCLNLRIQGHSRRRFNVHHRSFTGIINCVSSDNSASAGNERIFIVFFFLLLLLIAREFE